MRGLVQRHTEMYDRVFEEIVAGKKGPTMTDTAYTMSAGYL